MPLTPLQLSGLQPLIDAVNAANRSNATVTDTTVSTTSVEAIAANTSRRYLLIQNTHATNDLFINFGGAATTSDIQVAAGGNYEALIAPTESVNLIASAAGTTVVITEGVDIP